LLHNPLLEAHAKEVVLGLGSDLCSLLYIISWAKHHECYSNLL
jgi:hypothetical protein